MRRDWSEFDEDDDLYRLGVLTDNPPTADSDLLTHPVLDDVMTDA